MTVLFAVLGCIALLLALHPYITFPLSLMALAKVRSKPQAPAAAPANLAAIPDSSDRPPIAILLCVHNEENVIDGRIRNLIELAQTIPGTEILVYTDASTDSTVDILRQFGDRITLAVSEERHGKTHGMNLLVTKTKARFIVFTDAAVRMNADSLTNLLRHYEDQAVGCVCGRIIAVNGGSEDKLTATADTSIKYWAFDATIRRLESQVASVMGAHGPLFSIRRELHEPAPVELFDDFYVSMAVLYNGHRVVQAEDFCGFKAVATRREDEYKRKVRIACQSFNIHRLMLPRLREQTWLVRYLYASHKTLRWLTVFSLGAAAIFSSLAMWLSGLQALVLIAWAAFSLCIALGFAGIKPFSSALEAISALVANGVGVVQSLRGTVYQTWSSAKSARQAR